MPFPPSERKALLAVKGVGPTVVARLEQMGYESFAHLRQAHAFGVFNYHQTGIGHIHSHFYHSRGHQNLMLVADEFLHFRRFVHCFQSPMHQANRILRKCGL